MPEDMPDRMPEDMPDRMPEDMSDRMPEDLPVTKCIDVMVGITRSKVISFFCALAVVTHFALIRFYTQTTFCTEAFAQSSFYAQIFLHREVCAQKTFVHQRLYTQRFLRKEGSIYTEMLCTKMFLRA